MCAHIMMMIIITFGMGKIKVDFYGISDEVILVLIVASFGILKSC